MTAFELIDDLNKYNQDLIIQFDFGGYPNYIDSWRGSYNTPSIFWKMEDYIKLTVKQFINMLNKIDGMTVTGYKGGDFILLGTDDIHLSYNFGDYTLCIIESISKENNSIILHTKYKGN